MTGRPTWADQGTRLSQIRGRRADLLELFLELLRALEVSRRKLAPDFSLAQAQQQLLGRLLVDPLGRRYYSAR